MTHHHSSTTVVINQTRAPKAIGPYSQGRAAQGFYFFSGQLGLNPTTGELAAGLEAQLDQVLKNLDFLLIDSGLERNHVIKTTIFLTTMDHFAAVNGPYEQFFTSPYPARSTVAVKELPKQALVEIEMIAYRLQD